MPNIKLKDAQGNVQIHENVAIVKMKDTSNNDVYYKESIGVPVSFVKTTGETYSVMDVPQGVSVQAPLQPVREGYIFRGWSLVSHEFIPENKITFPHLFEEATTVYAMWEQRVATGVAQISGLGSELLTDVTFNVGEGFLDNLIEITDEFGDKYLEVPTLYRKITAQDGNGQVTGKILSFTKVDDTYIPYSVFKKPNGQVMPYVRIGLYQMIDSTRATSKSGTVKTFSIGAARTLAREKGTGYQLYDWQFRELFNDLAMVAEQSVDINKTTIIGITNWNKDQWIDGFANNSTQYLVCYDPSKYVDSPTAESDGYSALSYASPTGSNVYIKSLGYDSNHPFALFPRTTGGGAGTYYPDYFRYVSGNHPVYCNVGYAGADDGLFFFYGNTAWSYACACRLCYRPI